MSARTIRPDLVLSGVNNGQNLGDIINCSGTAAGAREGALHGALGIGMSQAVDYETRREINWDNCPPLRRRRGAQPLRSRHRARPLLQRQLPVLRTRRM